MSNKLVRRTTKAPLSQPPQYAQPAGVVESVGGLIYGAIHEYQRAKRRSRMLSFFMGALVCSSLLLFVQNLTRTPEVTRQPVIYRFAEGVSQPEPTPRRKASKPARKPKDRSEPLLTERY